MRRFPHLGRRNSPLLTSPPASVYQQILWLLKKAGKVSKDYAAYYIENPGEACEDTWDWIKRNKLTCFLLVSGALVIVVPVAIGFGPAGPIAGMLLLQAQKKKKKEKKNSHDAKSEIGSIAAGWQAGIGNVVAGSVFATLQSLTMTGVLTSIGGWMIGAGVLSFFASLNWGSAAKMLMRTRLEDDRNAFRKTITAAHCHVRFLKEKLHAAMTSVSVSASETRKLWKDHWDASKEYEELKLAKSGAASLSLDADEFGEGSDNGEQTRNITIALSRLRGLEKALDAALATNSSASDEDIRQLVRDIQEAEGKVWGLNPERLDIPGFSELNDESETSGDGAGLSSSFSRREDAWQSHGNSDASTYNSGKGKLNDTLTSSSSTFDEKIYQLEQDLQRANEQITALRLTQTGPSHPEEDTQISGSPPYRPRGNRRARPFIPGPQCPDNGYSNVAAEYKGRLYENPDLRRRLKREGRCVLCRQPGAPHTFPSRN